MYLPEALAVDDAFLKSVSQSKASRRVQYIITVAINKYMARFLLTISPQFSYILLLDY
jgi:hypothetical protein